MGCFYILAIENTATVNIHVQVFCCILVAQLVKSTPVMQETQVQSLGQKDPPEKEIATHSSILIWRIPWTEEPMRSQRVRHD